MQELHGGVAQAATLYVQSRAVFEGLGDAFAVADQCAHLANVARLNGDAGEARRLHRIGLAACHHLRNKPGIAKGFEGLAMLAIDDGQPERAARLLGAADSVREVTGTPVEAVDRAGRERAATASRAALGEEVFATTRAAGQALSLDAAVALALDG